MATSPPGSRPGALRRIAALSLNTWRETMRDRVVIGILVFIGVVQAVVLALEGPSPDHANAVLDTATALMNGVGALVAVFLGTSLVHKEMDKRTVYIVLAKPITRFEFLVGKYLGLLATLGAMVGVMTLYLAGLMLALGVFKPALLAVGLGFWMELGALTALTLLFATITSGVLSAVYALGLFILGHFGELVRVFADTEIKLSAFNYYGGWAFYYGMPHFELFHYAGDALYSPAFPWRAFGLGLGYGALFTLGTLALASVAWDARELT